MKFDLDKALDSNKTCVPLFLGIVLKHFFKIMLVILHSLLVQILESKFVSISIVWKLPNKNSLQGGIQ